MSEAGYIYVMINTAMEGIVKVGRTTRDVHERAKELSAATGIPTPFTVAYDAFFDDCVKAEEYVHALLEQRGYRISQNREFFSVPLNVVIKVVV